MLCKENNKMSTLPSYIYIVEKREMRHRNQNGPSLSGVVRHLESMHNVRAEEEAKEAMARQQSRVRRDAIAVDSIQ